MSYNIEELKSTYIGQVFNYLTVVDVNRVNGCIRFTCVCKCGKIIYPQMHTVVNKKSTSCGCYKHTEEFKNKYKDWCKNNESARLERNKKVSQWYKDNPEKVAELGKQKSDYFKENPDMIKMLSDKNKEYCKNNPDKVAERARKYSKWCSENPDKVIEKSEKVSTFYKEHPDARKHLSDIRREWHENNPEAALEINKKISQWRNDNRDIIDEHNRKFREDNACLKFIEVLHPDYVDAFLRGGLKVHDKVKTKCPMCGEYEEHLMRNVYVFSRHEVIALLCNKCSCSYTSSKCEQEVADFISTFYNGECIRNTRDVISPFELDIYYPEKRIAIEFNGDYWHNEEHHKRNYHYNKYIMCRNKGITLVSIFGSEWNNNRDNICNYIKDLFNEIQNNLSFVSHNIINNNYPPPGDFSIHQSVDHFYMAGKKKVYTCGYSIIDSN